ncbi:MAG: GNAT family N-acetyltransferase [Bryobacterales bacterium]|nr:GNAT family N-acetyltransferase [Bryobacterales bacterium]
MLSAAEAVELSLLEFFRHFARARAAGRVAELDGVSVAAAGIEFHMFNAAFFATPVTDAGADLDRRIEEAQSRLGAGDARWAFWAGAGKFAAVPEARLTAAFRRRGLYPAFHHPGMACESLAPPRKPLPALEFRRVQDRAGRAEFARLNCHAFHIPFEWCLELYDCEPLWTERFTGYIGCLQGQAVCGAATLCAADAVGVYAVATMPGHERKGYGESVMRHAVACAQRESGFSRSVLQATRTGIPLYQRMGYEPVTHFVVYT